MNNLSVINLCNIVIEKIVEQIFETKAREKRIYIN